MEAKLPGYSKVAEFISRINQLENTFLYDRLNKPDYAFWPHLEYFLQNINRWENYLVILSRLSLLVPFDMEISLAWGKWRQFRSAQFEITAIYIIENYLNGKVIEIEPSINKPTKPKTPDFRISFGRAEYKVEVKAQSGQQHGSKHPRGLGANMFGPQDEADLKSWLFNEEKISSRYGTLMTPMVINAEEKGADILFAMADIFNMNKEKGNLVSQICPSHKFKGKFTIPRKNAKPLVAYFYDASFPVKKELSNLKEIWLMDESYLNVLSSESVLFEHLKNGLHY